MNMYVRPPHEYANLESHKYANVTSNMYITDLSRRFDAIDQREEDYDPGSEQTKAQFPSQSTQIMQTFTQMATQYTTTANI